MLASGGVCCIDEFDKLSEDDRAALHEALESQIDKHSEGRNSRQIHREDRSACRSKPEIRKIRPEHLSCRAVRHPSDPAQQVRPDIPDKGRDGRRARPEHCKAHTGSALCGRSAYRLSKTIEQVEKPPIDHGFLRKYVAYAKKNVMPRLSDEAASKIQDYYIELRKLGSKMGTVPITPRQIEGLVRMAEASAKARLSKSSSSWTPSALYA